MTKLIRRSVFRRSLSFLLALSFVFSTVLSLTTAAAYTKADQLGAATSAVTSSDGLVTVNKTVSSASGAGENEFQITLAVTTAEKLQELNVPKDAAVVLVMDISNSMKYNLAGNVPKYSDYTASTWTNRLTLAKQAAVNFVNSFADADGAERMISIVKFGTNAEKVLGWTDAASSAAGKKAVTDAIGGVSCYGDMYATYNYRNEVNNYFYHGNGATNVEAGLQLAQNLLGQDAVKDYTMANTFVILLTDGGPTDCIYSNSTSTSTIYGYGSQSYYHTPSDKACAEEATAVSQSIRANDAVIYSIAFAAESATAYSYTERVQTGTDQWGNPIYENKKTTVTVGTWLNTISNKYYKADSADELKLVFENINKLIKLAAQLWTVTDPMGSYINYAGPAAANGNVSYKADTKTLTWNLIGETASGNYTRTGSGTLSDPYKYSYSLVYNIVLDTEAIYTANGGSFNTNAFYDTNGTTVLSYIETDGNGNVSQTALPKTLNFPIPTVRGMFGAFSFTKLGVNGIKLSGAEFTLAKTGSTFKIVKTSGSDGKVSFSNIPCGEYTLTETKAVTGYDAASFPTLTVSVSYGETVIKNGGKTISNGFEAQNTLIPTHTSLTVEKEWVDGNADHSGDSVKVYLTIDGAKQANTYVTLSASNNWTAKFDNLLIKNVQTGSNYVYGAVEEDIAGYGADYALSSGVLTITNTIEQEYITVSGTKTWYKPSDVSAPALTVKLMNGQTAIASQTLAAGATSFTFSADDNGTPLPKYDAAGAAISYTVVETVPSGWTAISSSASAANGWKLINKYDNMTISLEAVKIWSDGSTAEVELQLFKNGEAFGEKVTTSGLTYIFTNLDKYTVTVTDGVPSYTENVYTVAETSVDGYATSYDGLKVTNYKIPTRDITVSKVWIGGGKADSVTVWLTIDGVRTGKSVTLSNSNGWTAAFEDLDTYSNYVYGGSNTEIVYGVSEDTAAGYSAGVVTGSMSAGFTVTNTVAQEQITINVEKVWQHDTADSKSDVVINLYRGTVLVESKTIAASGNGTCSFTADKYNLADGSEYSYSITENTVSGYSTAISGSYKTGFTVTNTKLGDETSVTVSKVWIDGGMNHANDTVAVTLSGSDGSTRTATLNKDGSGWSYTFAELPTRTSEGKAITYTVDEDAVPAGYTKSIDGFTITNTITQVKLTVNVTKVWKQPVGTAAPAITVNLLANGSKIASKNITSGNTCSFAELDKYDASGAEISYSVTEDAVANYTTSAIPAITWNGNAGSVTITNTITGKTSVNVSKVWIDGNGTARPASVTVQLTANGSDVAGKTLTLLSTTATPWAGSFAELDMYDADGNIIDYGVKELQVAGYDKGVVTGSMDAGYTITNTLTQEYVSITINKVWNNDAGSYDKAVKFFVNGTEYTLEAGETSLVIENLPKYDSSRNAITYAVTEESLNGYTTAKSDLVWNGNAGTIAFTNTASGTRDISVTKVWIGTNAAAQPSQIVFNLLYKDSAGRFVPVMNNGAAVTATGTSANWNASFTGLSKFDANGKTIEYAITENAVENYSTAVTGNMNDGFTVTNTAEIASVSITINKKWIITNGTLTPDATLELYRTITGGTPEKVGEYTFEGGKVLSNMTGAAESYTFEAKYPEYDANYNRYTYYAVETNVPESYEKTESGLTVTNKLVGTTAVTVTKTWIDLDGAEHDEITAQLYRSEIGGDAVKVGEEFKVADSKTIEGLDKYYYSNGQAYEYTYSVKEVGADENYDVSEDGLSIVNTIKQQLISVDVSKVWNGDSGSTGYRTPVTVQLILNGTAIEGKTITLDSEGQWTGSFTELEKYSYVDGTAILNVYSVKELTSNIRYKSAVTGNQTDGFTVTNTFVPPVVPPDDVSVTITKTWVGSANIPAEITVSLYRGTEKLRDVTLKASEGWTATVSSLSGYYSYSVSEVEVNGFRLTKNEITRSGNDISIALENTYVRSAVTVSGSKTWLNLPEGYAIPAITVELRANGEVINTLTLQPGTTAYSFTNDSNGNVLYDVDGNGNAISYSVTEQSVAGFTASYNGYDISNTYIDEYSYRIDRHYAHYLDENLVSGDDVTGTVVKSYNGEIVTPDTDLYAEFGGMTYEFIEGDTSKTVDEANKIVVLDLYYEISEFTPVDPPLDPGDGDQPHTGTSASGIYAAIAALSGTALAALLISGRKKEER